jgi:hypothetical protein
MKIKTLREVFGLDGTTYLMGIAYETMGYEEDNPNGEATKKGWMVPYQEVDVDEIDAFSEKYMIEPRSSEDSRMNWDGGDTFITDEMSGDETYYTMFVKNLDGSDLSPEEFDAINQKIAEEPEENGISINSVPFSLHY